MKTRTGRPKPGGEYPEDFRLLVENVRDYAIFKLDPEGRVATWNPGAQRMKGYAATEIIGQPLSRFYTPEEFSQGEPARQLNIARESGQWAGEGWRMRKDGSRFWAEVTITALRTEGGELHGFAKITRDATERKRAEEETRRLLEVLQQEKDKISSLVKSISDEVWFADTNKQFTQANPSARHEFGLDPAKGIDVEKLAASLEVLRPDGSPRPVEEAPPLRALRGEIVRDQEEIVRTPASGELRYRQVSSAPVRNTHGAIIGSVSIVRDITERKRAAEALRESEERLKLLGDNLPDSVVYQYTHEPDGTPRFLYISAGVERLNSVKTEEVLRDARALHCQILPDQLPVMLEAERVSARDLSVFEFEAQMRLPDGQIRWMHLRSRPRRLADGRVMWDGVQTDITKRKRAEEALRESEAQLRAILDQAPCGITIRAMPSGQMLLQNEQANHIMGRTVPGLGDVHNYRGVHPDGRPYAREDYAIMRAAEKGEIVRGEELTFQRADGARLTLNVSAAPIHDAQGRVIAVVSVFDDITGRKSTEEALRDSENRLATELTDMRRLHKVTTHFIRRGDLRTVMEAILDAATSITGADKGHVQLLDAASGELRMEVHQGYEPAYVEYFSHIRLGTVACGTAAQTRQAVIIEDITAHPLILAEPRALELFLAAGVRALVCTPLVAGSGRVVGVLSAHFAATHQPTERDLRLLDLLASQAADFVERTEAEEALRRVREELKQANANLERKVEERTLDLQGLVEELEHFSYTITHDLRAPLRAMQGFARLMQQDCMDSLSTGGREYLDLIKTSATRMDLLITDALQYNKAGKESMPIGPVNAAALLQEIIESYPDFQPPQAQIRIDGNIPMVLGNKAGLTQCFSNLLGNAVKFVEPGRVPEVRVFAGNREGFVRLWFQDNGIGIPAQAHNKIFQMFHRATDKFEGTGIGLALAKKVTERMGGRIGVDSADGQGSRFWVDLKPAH